jgi:hypothetical protein
MPPSPEPKPRHAPAPPKPKPTATMKRAPVSALPLYYRDGGNGGNVYTKSKYNCLEIPPMPFDCTKEPQANCI